MTDLSIKEIQDIMGHADINTTMNIYAEVHPDMKKKSLTKMAGKIIINRSDMSINEAIACEDEDDVKWRHGSRFCTWRNDYEPRFQRDGPIWNSKMEAYETIRKITEWKRKPFRRSPDDEDVKLS